MLLFVSLFLSLCFLLFSLFFPATFLSFSFLFLSSSVFSFPFMVETQGGNLMGSFGTARIYLIPWLVCTPQSILYVIYAPDFSRAYLLPSLPFDLVVARIKKGVCKSAQLRGLNVTSTGGLNICSGIWFYTLYASFDCACRSIEFQTFFIQYYHPDKIHKVLLFIFFKLKRIELCFTFFLHSLYFKTFLFYILSYFIIFKIPFLMIKISIH